MWKSGHNLKNCVVFFTLWREELWRSGWWDRMYPQVHSWHKTRRRGWYTRLIGLLYKDGPTVMLSMFVGDMCLHFGSCQYAHFPMIRQVPALLWLQPIQLLKWIECHVSIHNDIFWLLKRRVTGHQGASSQVADWNVDGPYSKHVTGFSDLYHTQHENSSANINTDYWRQYRDIKRDCWSSIPYRISDSGWQAVTEEHPGI